MWVCQRKNASGDDGGSEFFAGVAMGGVVLWTKQWSRAVTFDEMSEAETVVNYYAKRFSKEFADARLIDPEGETP